ncbi:glycine zipper 2TM domain-containing protein [Neisseria sp. Ec49-e6-T10]|uniref:glycine zipper 2TM domain-containing protein n=1 Tax=Neisseria sp. Ec49-e6-T10 TaxID=3140744 RepID=UPI003EB7B52F
MFKTSLKYLFVACFSASLVACGTSSAGYYNTTEARTAQTVRLGTVVSVNEIAIHNDSSDLLTVAGAAIGGVAGNSVGKGNGRILGTIVGAVIGGYGAQKGQEAINRKGYEITVRLDDSNQLISVVQAADINISTGQRVKIVSGGKTDRVLPINN